MLNSKSMPQCAICRSELKTIPAGTSKTTGKPYQAFLACPNRCIQPKGAIPPQQSQQSTAKNDETMISLLAVLKEMRDILKIIAGVSDYGQPNDNAPHVENIPF